MPNTPQKHLYFLGALLLCAVQACTDKSPASPGASRAGQEATSSGVDEAGEAGEDAPPPEPEKPVPAADSGEASSSSEAPAPATDVDAGSEAAAGSGGGDAAGSGGAGAAAPNSVRAAAPDSASYYPGSLFETGLYAADGGETLAEGVYEYEPAFALWSDSASKKRYLYLPPGTKIDTSDMDNWVFPVGTKAWKEFTRDGVRVETRLLQKLSDRWFMMAFAWSADQKKAAPMEDGQKNANGTEHDIPNAADCATCHDGAADKLLGVGAIQLSHAKPGLTLTKLVSDGRLTQPPAGEIKLPGDAATVAALGALHANCGSCHNPRGTGLDRAKDLLLWLTVDSLARVEDTTTYASTVGVPLRSEEVPGASERIVAGDPSASGLLLRLEAQRATKLTMPPLATEQPDADTASTVRKWIMGM